MDTTMVASFQASSDMITRLHDHKEIAFLDYLEAVEKWWLGKLVVGTQLSRADVVDDYDVRGGGPWWPWVAVDELVQDAERKTGMVASAHYFNRAWNIVCPYAERRKKKAYWPAGQGMTQMNWRSFMKFPQLDDCRKLSVEYHKQYLTPAKNRV